MDEITEKITKFVRKLSQLDEADVLAGDTKILSLGYIDSFNILAIINFIEEEFEIKIDANNITLEQFDSIGDIARLVRELQGNS